MHQKLSPPEKKVLLEPLDAAQTKAVEWVLIRHRVKSQARHAGTMYNKDSFRIVSQPKLAAAHIWEFHPQIFVF